MTEYTFEINRNTINKIVHCPHCNRGLECWGYMAGANINCRFCGKQFVLDENLWENSFVIVISKCSHCKKATEQAITKHTATYLDLKCLTCEKTSIKLLWDNEE